MKIIVDAHGGDNAPLEVLLGCSMAVRELDLDIMLVGREEEIKKLAADNNISLDRIEIKNAESVITMEDDPVEIVKSLQDCSMAVGLRALSAGEGDAFVCGGNTGGLVVGANAYIRRIKGIKRSALAPIIPAAKGYFLLLDAGANIECKPEMLQQFGIMGSIYMQKVGGVKSPRVGLLNIGEEETKGTQTYIEAYKLLSDTPVNFVGNAEARYLPSGNYDVIVADGFSGNIVLKLIEGMGSTFVSMLRDIFSSSLKGKISALLSMKKLKEFKKSMDYKEYGGAILLGVSAPVVKAHGSSDSKAFKNAIRQAKLLVENRVVEDISDTLRLLHNDQADEKA